MILEHDVIEQIEEDPLGKTFTWVGALIRSLSEKDPFTVLHRMWRAGYIEFVTDDGETIPPWRTAQIFGSKAEHQAVRIVATYRGSRWVHGR